MLSNAMLDKIHQYFPDVEIKFKNQSLFMKILGMIMFFNPGFMTSYITTIGYTVYFPSEEWLNATPTSGVVTILHELIHISDAKRLTRPLFSFLYLCPQIMVLVSTLLFLLTWKIAIPLILLFCLPIPAYFRMIFEKRAYFVSLYVYHQLDKKGYQIDLEQEKTHILTQFTGAAYYFMWPFNNLKNEFDAAVIRINNDERPYENPAFDIIDDILTSI